MNTGTLILAQIVGKSYVHFLPVVAVPQRVKNEHTKLVKKAKYCRNIQMYKVRKNVQNSEPSLLQVKCHIKTALYRYWRRPIRHLIFSCQ